MATFTKEKLSGINRWSRYQGGGYRYGWHTYS
jgi:hypothetical protein